MPVINTNHTALASQQHLSKSKASLATSMERLSSGLRVNSAKDDAAGQAIANRMETNLRANSTVIRGINDGVSLMQTAEGGLDSVNGILHRSRELAVQAANGTLSDADRASLNAEYKELREEIDRIAMSTEAFGKYPLAPSELLDVDHADDDAGDTSSILDLNLSEGQVVGSDIRPLGFIPEGTKNFVFKIDSYSVNDDIQVFTQSGEHVAGTMPDSSRPNDTWTGAAIATIADLESNVFTKENGFLEGASYVNLMPEDGSAFYQEEGRDYDVKGMKVTYSGDGHPNAGDNGEYTEVFRVDEVKEPLFILVSGVPGSGSFEVKEINWDQKPSPGNSVSPISEGVDIVTSANAGQKVGKVTIEPTPADHVSLGLEDVELDPIEKAREAMNKLQEALNQVDGYRSQYGALQNRFESALGNLENQSVNTAAAKSRIMDADYAQEASSMVKMQILQQAGTSVLAQANQLPQSVLSLLG
ncbi:flagellin [Halomonas sp.]|uniref:flagellin N-terminal helical domain-containing protein n=1 Tax=Halomonas sp. TaxID=1486246 RepID=UPI003A907B39